MDDIKIHIHINGKMNSLLERVSFLDLGLFNDDLNSLIKSGLIRKYRDCLILKSNVSTHKVKLSDFIDRTGYECFINKINLENYLLNSSKDASFFIQRTFLTLLEIIKLITELDESKSSSYNFIFSINQSDKNISLHSYVLRFHKLREGELWLESDLNSYQEALMVLTFTKNNTNTNIEINNLINLFLSEIQKRIGK